jgi:putative ABC transport system permease protein
VDTDADVAKDVDAELAFHLEMRAQELCAEGLGVNEALAEARRRFGDADDVRRHALVVSAMPRRRWKLREWSHGWLHDWHFAVRQLRRAPLFSTIAILTLALGIGANSAMFSVIHRLLLEPLPFADGNRMVALDLTDANGVIGQAPDRAVVDAWRARAHSFDDMTVTHSDEYVVADGLHETRERGIAVAPNLFSFLGIHPAVGRTFTTDDARDGAEPVVIIGYSFWQQRYADSLDVLGQRLRVDSVFRTVVGVAPARFSMPFLSGASPVVWTPLPVAASANGDRRAERLQTMGKLRVGVTVEQARAELTTITASITDTKRAFASRARVMRAQDFLGGSYRRALVLLFGAVCMVLLIACANVAHLLLARAWNRQREFVVRRALGAGRARVARQLFCESMVLGVFGGALGLGFAWIGLHVILALRPVELENLSTVNVESTVLVWTLAISLLSSVLFGCGPALFASARQPGDMLQAGNRVANVSTNSRHVRGGLIVGEVALSVVLLVVAGLLLRTYTALQRVPLGFDPHNLVGIRLQLPTTMPKEMRAGLFSDALERLRRLPGIEGASVGGLPPDNGINLSGVETEGRSPDETSDIRVTGLAMVLPGYFQVAGIRLRGDGFHDDSTGREAGSRDEVIVNETLARKLWPDGNALGSRLRLGARGEWMTVVGVANDLATPGARGDRYDFQLYLPARPLFPSTTIVLRTRASLDAAVPSIRAAVAATSAELTIGDVTTSDAQLRGLLAAPRFAMTLLGAFAFVALTLSAIGLYGVISYSVGQRTHEIGVRVALGAQPRDVARLVVGEGGVLVLLGLAAGIAGAALASRSIRAYLFGVAAGDLATYVVVTLLLGCVALAACFYPMRRAMHVDPVVALRAE